MIETILLFILILAVLVLVHELGHFVAAKLMNVRVEEFGFGLPPKVLWKKFGETIYSLNLLPIGGFVRLYGEDEQHPEYVKSEKHRAFFSKKTWQRAIILIAGVCMNLVLAWVVYTYLFTQGVQVPGEEVRVEEVAINSPAQDAGIEKGDIVREIRVPSEKEVKTITIKTSEDLIQTTDQSRGREITIVVDRSGERIEKTVTPREKTPENEGAIGVVISNYVEKKYPWSQAPILAFNQVISLIGAIVTGLGMMIWKLITFQDIRAEVAGPVGIGRIVGQAKEIGSFAVLETLAVLSVNLAVINIAPFPALDGGRLLFVVIEALTGKKVDPRWEQRLHQAGMALLLFLLLLITINDVVKLGRGQI
jgi:regulator of sigma E protease